MNDQESSSAQDVREVSDINRLNARPLVSVLMTTYNHATYIADAIEGVIAQRCDFAYELLIGEDASTDTTRQIALNYQRKHAGVIRVVFSDSNVGVHANIRRIFARARGEFIAFCEGDDFWCAPDKLARQIELFRNDDGIGAVHSNWVRMKSNNGTWVTDWKNSVQRRVPLRLLEGNVFSTFYFPKLLRTCTVIYRRSALLEYYASPLGVNKYRFGDAAMAAFISSRWVVAYLPQVTAVYRLSPGSLLRSGKKAMMQHMQSCLDFDTDARRFFQHGPEYPTGFRWEASVGLFLWALLARDASTARFALADIRQHFGVLAFVRDGWKSLWMRLPSIRRLR